MGDSQQTSFQFWVGTNPPPPPPQKKIEAYDDEPVDLSHVCRVNVSPPSAALDKY